MKAKLEYVPWVIALIAIVLSIFLYFRSFQIEQREAESRTSAQNRIAEMSQVIQEANGTYSRLAQERHDIQSRLGEANAELARLIESREEEIQSVTTAQARIAPIAVVGPATQEVGPTQERTRIAFETTHEGFLRIQGYTLSNPAEYSLSLSYIRPVNFTVVTSQLPDLSWRTYVQSDYPGMEIGEIESTVNPLSRPAMQRRWEQDISIGLFGAASVVGTSGIFGADIGYDFGSVELSIMAGGITYPGSTDFLIGGRLSVAPFDL